MKWVIKREVQKERCRCQFKDQRSPVGRASCASQWSRKMNAIAKRYRRRNWCTLNVDTNDCYSFLQSPERVCVKQDTPPFLPKMLPKQQPSKFHSPRSLRRESNQTPILTSIKVITFYKRLSLPSTPLNTAPPLARPSTNRESL